MSKLPASHDRANAFDELLWQISGELAMTPASASLAAAPFLDIEPDPTPSPEPRAAAAPSAAVAPRRGPARGWAAAGLAVVLGFAGFMFGTTATTGEPVVADNIAHASAEHEFLSEGEAMLEQVRSSSLVVIPHAEAPSETAVTPVAEVEAPAAVVTPRAKPKAKAKPRTKTRPKARKVSFDDL